jgi:putative transposase
MPDYRRFLVPGGTYFFTLATYQRRPLFARPENVELLRAAVATVQRESPFNFLAAVVLPDHLHFLWTLPPGDQNYSKRIGRLKVFFTKSLPGLKSPAHSVSRQKHRESEVWQRRFWEHTIDDASELEAYMAYIHFNPVKHGLVPCPHLWPASSFSKWVANGLYEPGWGCCCRGASRPMDIAPMPTETGEP